MSSQAVVQISRGALLAMSAGVGSLYLYSNGQSPGGLVPPYLQRLLLGRLGPGGAPQLSGGSSAQQEYLALTQQLSDLSSEVARMRLQAAQGNNGYYYDGRGGGWSWGTIITVGGVGVVILYFKGYSLDDFMYVTKQALSTAVQALEVGLDDLGIALDTAKRELSYKLGLVDEKLEETRDTLEKKITDEVGDVKRELEFVGSDVKGISHAQHKVHGMVESIENQIENIDGALSTANRGIYLLCNVVAENMGTATKGATSHNQNNRSRGSSLYDDLLAYTRGAMATFSRSGKDDDATTPAGIQSMPLPSSDDGLKMLDLGRGGSTLSAPVKEDSSRSLVEHVLGRSASLSSTPVPSPRSGKLNE